MKLNGLMRGVLLLGIGVLLLVDTLGHFGVLSKVAGPTAGGFNPGMIAGPVAIGFGLWEIWKSRRKLHK